MLKGKSIEEAMKIKNEDVADSLELTDIKRHCSVLAKEAIEAAIKDYSSKKEGGTDIISITEAAGQKLRELLIEHNGLGIAISVNPGGCSGIDYTLSYQMDECQNEEMDTNVIGGITFLYERKIKPFIIGLEIDLMENSFGHGFVISNKNFTPCQGCTCGRKNDCKT
jgi:iron-sulfur cluster assembly accessory protein